MGATSIFHSLKVFVIALVLLGAPSIETAIGGEPTSGLTVGATVDMSPGEEKFYQSCDTECHGPRDPQTFTMQEWKIVTQTMFEWANVEENDRKLILDFLIKNASDAR